MRLQQQRVFRLAPRGASGPSSDADRVLQPLQRLLVGRLGAGCRPAAAPASPARSRRAPNRTRPSASGAPAGRPACRSGRAWPGPAAPSRAPCRSRDSRTRPAAIGGRPGTAGMADSSSSARKASSGFAVAGGEGLAIAENVAVDLGLAVLARGRSRRDRGRSWNSGRARRRLPRIPAGTRRPRAPPRVSGRRKPAFPGRRPA